MDILWCCHVRGPDDVHPAPDYETALKWADMFNEWTEKANAAYTARYPDSDPDNAPKAAAVPAPWPWTAEAWANGLAQAIREMSPRNPPAPVSRPSEEGS